MLSDTLEVRASLLNWAVFLLISTPCGFEQTLRPKMPLYKSFDAAAEAVQTMLSANATAPSVPEEVEEDEEDEEGSVASLERNLESSSSSDDSDSSDSETDDPEEDSGQEEEVSVVKSKSGLTEEEEAEFSRDLAKMMSDAGTTKSLNTRANLDVGLPMMLRRDGQTGPQESSANHVMFNLLTKKGARPQVSALLPHRVCCRRKHADERLTTDLAGQEL